MTGCYGPEAITGASRANFCRASRKDFRDAVTAARAGGAISPRRSGADTTRNILIGSSIPWR